MITYVLRWNGFEQVIETGNPFPHPRIEILLNGPLKVIEPAEEGKSALLPLWAFEFVKVDEEGRLIYDATTNPPVV